MAFRKSVGKTLIKAAVGVAVVNTAISATVCAVVCHMKKKAEEEEAQNDNKSEKHFDVFMQGRQIKLGEEEFKKVKVKSFMGGVDLDLREAVIKEDTCINCKSFMGGINIRVPEGVNVVVKGKSVMGGITNFVPRYEGEDIPTIYVDANQVMGGLCIKAGAPDPVEKECCDCEGQEENQAEEGSEEKASSETEEGSEEKASSETEVDNEANG